MSAKAKRAGRPPRYMYGSEKMTPYSFRVTDAHRQKLEKLGGSVWLRKKIDEA